MGAFLKLRYIGYWLLALVLVLAGGLGLATPFITILFAYFLLDKLRFARQKWLSILLFCLIGLSAFYAFAFFVRHAVIAFPKIAATAIPSVIDFAQDHGIHLPFEDAHSLRELALDKVKTKLGEVGQFAKIASKEFVFLLIGLVVAVSLFLNPAMDLDEGIHPIKRNYYSLACRNISRCFASFYGSFTTVMGGQIIISLLNTGLTSVFLLCIHLPYTSLVILLTFVCGLIPIVGNLISNSAIVAISFTISPQLAFGALIFLLVLHKLEYFLNSKIVGDRIRNPVWLTLLGLIIGERLMGIPGMVLAPVILNFIKIEAATVEVPDHSNLRNSEQC